MSESPSWFLVLGALALVGVFWLGVLVGQYWRKP
jgi:hypothetical protein